MEARISKHLKWTNLQTFTDTLTMLGGAPQNSESFSPSPVTHEIDQFQWIIPMECFSPSNSLFDGDIYIIIYIYTSNEYQWITTNYSIIIFTIIIWRIICTGDLYFQLMIMILSSLCSLMCIYIYWLDMYIPCLLMTIMVRYVYPMFADDFTIINQFLSPYNMCTSLSPCIPHYHPCS